MKKYKCVWSVGDKKPNEFIDIASTDELARLLSLGAIVEVESDEKQSTETTETNDNNQEFEADKPKRGRPSNK